MRLVPVSGNDPRHVLRALRSAMGAGPAILLGDPSAPEREVPAGTAVVIRTSGSTGIPKSVVLSRSALTASALATRERIGAGRWLLALSPTYVAGIQVLVRGLIEGEEPAILSGKFTAAAFTHVVTGMHSCSGGEQTPLYTSLVPAQLSTVVDVAERNEATADALRKFAAILVGGQALPETLAERAVGLGARVVRTYGSSETSGGCVYDGVPLSGVDIRTVDGEIQVGGNMLATEYLDDHELTVRSFVETDGRRWYRTGDLGEFGNGRVRVVGRRDRVIVSGGVNVSLDRLEAVVASSLGRPHVAAIAASDERWGEVPELILVASPGESAPELLVRAREAARQQIGVAARPRRVHLVAELPRLASGKIDRMATAALVDNPAAAAGAS